MPTIFRWNGYRFFFFSNEGEPLEPVHIHVRKGSSIAKFWIEPEVILSNSFGLSATELRKLQAVIYENSKLIKEQWNEYFGI